MDPQLLWRCYNEVHDQKQARRMKNWRQFVKKRASPKTHLAAHTLRIHSHTRTLSCFAFTGIFRGKEGPDCLQEFKPNYQRTAYNCQHCTIAVKMCIWINLSVIGIFQRTSGTKIPVFFCYSNCDQEWSVSCWGQASSIGNAHEFWRGFNFQRKFLINSHNLITPEPLYNFARFITRWQDK